MHILSFKILSALKNRIRKLKKAKQPQKRKKAQNTSSKKRGNKNILQEKIKVIGGE